MTFDTVMVLTGNSIDTILRAGGTGNWKVKKSSIKRCLWVVAVRHRHSEGIPGGPEQHGAAFLIGRVRGVKPSPRGDGRFVIVFDRYAQLNGPNVWPLKQRNPVKYTRMAKLQIDPDKLEWKDFDFGLQETSIEEPSVDGPVPAGQVIERARLMIARSLAVPPAAVKISIDV